MSNSLKIEQIIKVLNNSKTLSEASKKLSLSERQIQRILKSGKCLPPSCYLDTNLVKVTNKNEVVEENSYTYNETTDTYIVNVRGITHPILMSGTQHKNLLRQYSNLDGDPSTINELSRTFGLPRRHLIGYLKVFGITHDSLPFSDQELNEKTDSELIEDARIARQRVLFEKIEKDKWKEEKKDAEKWRSWKQNTLDVIEKAIRDNLPDYSPIKLQIPTSKFKFGLVINLQDIHFGKGSSIFDVGPDNAYNLEICEKRLVTCVTNLIAMVLKHGRPEKIYVVAGGDVINADNFKGITTSGTQQDNEVSITTALWKAKRVFASIIDMLRQITDFVEIIPLPGNHDRVLSIQLADWLHAWFRNCSDVSCDVNGRSRQYRKYYKTLLAFSHNDGLKAEKAPIVIAQEARKLWGETEFCSLYTGHYHFRLTRDIDGVQQQQASSISGEDRWHEINGYTTSRRGIMGHLVSSEFGPFCDIFSPVINHYE